MKKALSAVTVLAIFVSSCIRTYIPIPPPPHTGSTTPDSALTITGLSATTGAGGSNITIYGTGFSTTLADDQVTINGKTATVVSAAADSLVITIPVKAGTGIVGVTVGSTTATGPALTYKAAWVVTTFAGSTKGTADGSGTGAQFFQPMGICSDAAGNLYVTDAGNNELRKITTAGVVSTLAANAAGWGICIGKQGTLYFCDPWDNCIRQYTTAGGVTTITGGAQGYYGGPVSQAQFNFPAGICTDSTGVLYVSDAGNSIIRDIYAGAAGNIAGNPCNSGYTDGIGTQAMFSDPYGLCTDGQGTLYIADTYSQRICKLVAQYSQVTTIAGSHLREGTRDGAGNVASFFQPGGVCVDINGNLYVADTQNHLIRMITPDGTVSTIAGTGNPGDADGIGTAASFNQPFGICINSQGVLYVADSYNNKIRQLVAQ
ncbi:MAG TPA: IPT/TIG domain-containing protein [Puia sp.]|nr:IPT/TIG domain-containing protein [Puia sp.]